MSDTPSPGPAGKAPPIEAAQRVGEVISDRYKLVELIARGGMGAVYKAEHLLLRKWVAVKLLHPHTRDLPEQVLRFEREAIAGAHLQHPNIAAATDFGKLPDGSYFLVLEYARGLTLEDVIRGGALPAARAVRIARQIAAALAAAHERGVIHRDIKPHNIMLDTAQGDLVKVVDFGLAKVPLERFDTTDKASGGRGVHRAITQKDMVFGTVAYMSPEAGGGMDKVDERSDLYALGIILYEMFTGRHPFDGTERLELFRQQCTTPPPPFRERAPEVSVPGELEAIVMRLLRKDPAQRYGSALEVIDALEDAMPQVRPPPRGGSSPGLGDWKDAPSQPERATPPGPPAPAQPAAAASPPAAVAPPAAAQPPTKTSVLSSLTSLSMAWPELRRKRRLSRAIVAGIVVAVGVLLGVTLLRSLPSSDAPPPEALEAEATASASPGASPGSTAPAADPGLDRRRVLEAVKLQEWASGEEALLRLLQADAAAFRDREVKQAAAVLAGRIAGGTDARASQVLEWLEKRLGEDGLEVLYEVAAGQSGSRGAERALEVLRRPEVRGRLSPALKIAVELREAPCPKKAALFERAGREGDERAAVVLDALRSPPCKPKGGQCCVRGDAALERAVKAIRGRQRR